MSNSSHSLRGVEDQSPVVSRLQITLDECLADPTLSNDSRLRLSAARQELSNIVSSPAFIPTPLSVSLSVARNATDDLEASKWLWQTFNSPLFGASNFTGVAAAPVAKVLDEPPAALGMPQLDLSVNTDVHRATLRFSRTTLLNTAAFAHPEDRHRIFESINEAFFGTLVHLEGCGEEDLNVLSILASLLNDERRLFLSVVASVFSYYNFVSSLSVDIAHLSSFLSAMYESMSQRANPFHNATRIADVLHTVHSFLKQPHVAQHFSDLELLSVLVATLSMDAGHCGVSNEFLSRTRHTLAVLFGDHCPQEQAALTHVLGVLERDEYNFMSNNDAWADDPDVAYEFSHLVTEIILGSAHRNHDTVLQKMRVVASKGVVADEDVATLLAAVVHAADYSYILKRRPVHIDWVTRLLTENCRQGEEEERRRLRPSPLCGADAGEHASSAILAVVRVALLPLFDCLSSVVPSWWQDRLTRTHSMYQTASATSGREDDDHATSPPILFESLPVDSWTDVNHPVMGTLRRAVGGGAPVLDRKASQHAILHATPQRQLSASQFAESLSATANPASARTDHYFAFLRMFDAYDRDERTFAEFGGRLVFLAAQLDPLYIGNYAGSAARGDFSAVEPCAQVAVNLIRAEQPPMSAEVLASPSKRNRETSDAFLLQLLHTFARISEGRVAPRCATSASAAVATSAAHNGSMNAPTVMTPTTPSDVCTAQPGTGPYCGARRRIYSDNPIYSKPGPGSPLGGAGN